MSVTIPLREGDGWYNSQTRRPIEKSDLMRALADTKTFLVRARYNQEQVQARWVILVQCLEPTSALIPLKSKNFIFSKITLLGVI